jgi:hypothetical protein
MRSVADELRLATVRRAMALAAEDRIRLALALHRRDVESYRLAQDPSPEAAEVSRRLRRERRCGRAPSPCIEALEA